MASKMVHCRRVITYLPNLRTVVVHSRSFSSAADKVDLPFGAEITEDTGRGTVWPDRLLGPLGPQDRRFPMPGLVGPCVNTHRLAQDLRAVPLPPPPYSDVSPEASLPQLPEHRQFDICEQFLTSIDEIELDFIDSKSSEPSLSDAMEYRANACPELLRKEFKDLFPDRNILEGELTIINISLKTKNDMTLWSPEVEEEREALLDSFIQGAVEICQGFEDSGFWADFIDPASGKPFKGPHTNFTLFETDERYRKLGFEIQDLGCCKVISHPVWGAHAYIGSLFTTAPLSHPLIMNLSKEKC